jgi:streptomycin 6-kinase
MILPPDFVNNVVNSFGILGRNYLADLENLLLDTSHRWNLTLGEPFRLSYNYVCAVTRVDGTPAVLKIGVPNRELTSEISALNIYRGDGACRLLKADVSQGILLLERLLPGKMLSKVEDDDQATEIAAKVMQRIQIPQSVGDGFISLHDWFDELNELRSLFGGSTGPFPEKTVSVVEGMLPELFADQGSSVLLHGDFHHFNILLSERGWLVIDPKGVVGPPEYDAGPFLLNPWGNIPDEKEALRRTQRRVAILSEQLGFERRKLLNWALCHSLLSAWWDTKEDGTGGETSRAWAEIFLRAQI